MYTNLVGNKIRTKSRNCLFLGLTTYLFLFPEYSLATSNEEPFELSLEQLFNATVISASKTEDKWWTTPASVYVVDNQDIQRSGATSIPEALRLVPGVQVARVNASGWAVSVRGFNGALANKLLVLMDGREIYDPLFSGVYWDIQDTPLEDIERIEVIRGPGASLWGANAVNGVINIITKSAADTQGGLLSGGAGNQEHGFTTGRYGVKLGENGYYRIYGKYLNHDNEKNLAGINSQDNWSAGRGGFRADWKGNDKKSSFTLQGDAYQSDSSQLRTTPLLSAPYSRTGKEEITARGGNILARWKQDLQDDARLSIQSYVDFTSREQMLVEDRRTSFDLDAQYELPVWNRHKFIIGGRYRYSADELTPSSFVSLESAERNDQTFSGFMQDQITLQPEKWLLTLGTKFEHNDYSGFELQPNARLQWHPNETQMLWTSISRAVRTPSRIERDVNVDLAAFPPSVALPVPILLQLQANSDYDSEELTAYEAGYRHKLTSDLSFDISTFYNDYSKLATNRFLPFTIVNNGVDPLHILFPIHASNDTKGESYGLETTLDWQALEVLELSVGYSLLEIALHGPEPDIAINAESAEEQSPQHQFNVRSMWDITNDLSLDTMLYYVSSLPAYQVPDYWRLDTRLGWKINRQLQFSLVAQNMLDSVHREFGAPSDVNSIEVGRSIYGKLTWRF